MNLGRMILVPLPMQPALWNHRPTQGASNLYPVLPQGPGGLGESWGKDSPRGGESLFLCAVGLEAWFKSQPQPLPAVDSWADHFTSLCLYLLIYKMSFNRVGLL